MKRIGYIIILLGFGAIHAFSQNFFLDENGITIKCENCVTGDTGTVNGILYEAVDRPLLEQRRDEGADLSKVCTSLVTDMDSLFYLMHDFNENIGSWDVSNVTDMSYMFAGEDAVWSEGAMKFNKDIGSWDVGNVEDMSFMFYADTAFNQNLGSWDVSNVTNMSHMFAGMYSIFSEPIPSKFNMDISSWDVSKVTDMSNMFNICKFNMPVGTWNVGNVRNMSSMFAGQYKDGETPDFFSLFDQDIGSWDVSKVEDMSSMFYTSYFNSDIGDWDVGNVTNMSWMFCLAGLFNQDIGDWDVSNVTNMDIMFVWACDFNQDLSGWCVEKIDSIPYSFNDYCTFNKAFYPFWGTCPAAVHINDTDNAGSLSTYPNPASTFLTIETGISGLYDIEISSLNGRLLYQWEYEEPVIQLDLSSFQSGIYFITISSEDFVTTRKIVKL